MVLVLVVASEIYLKLIFYNLKESRIELEDDILGIIDVPIELKILP